MPRPSSPEQLASVAPWRAALGGVLAPLLFVTVLLSPLPLDPEAHRLAAVFAAIIVLWVSEAIPIAATALLIAPLLVFLGIADAKEAFKHYANPLLFLFVGGFFIAEAMNQHGLDRRLAKAVVLARWVRGRPARTRVALMVAGGTLSMWISNTATTAILAPILLGILGDRRDRAAVGGLLALAYTCSVGGLGTLVGSPPNLITVGLLDEAGHTLSFFDWMKIALPTAVLLAVAVGVVVGVLFPPGEKTTTTTTTRSEALFDDVPKRWSRGEIVTALAFGLAVLGWMLPGLLEIAAWLAGLVHAAWLPSPEAIEAAAARVSSALPSGAVALLAASILFMVPDGQGSRVLTWKRAARIDWGIIMLFGGGIALGSALVSTGLAAAVSRGFVAVSGIDGLWSLTALCCVFTIFFTEVCSNTASSNMLIPLVIAIATELEVSPVPPALAVGLAASCAFMLPIATGPNAVIFGTGRVTQPQMIRAGLALNLVSAVVVFVSVRVLCPIFGWT